MRNIISLLYLKFSNCERKVKSVSRRAWTSWGSTEKNSENRTKKTGSYPARINVIKNKRGESHAISLDMQ